MNSKFQVDDLVWAKMKGYPPWPAKVVCPLLDSKPPKNKISHSVCFFGTNDFAWIAEEDIVPHHEGMLKSIRKKGSAAYKNAIDAFIKVFCKTQKDEQDSSGVGMSENDYDLLQTKTVKKCEIKVWNSKMKREGAEEGSTPTSKRICNAASVKSDLSTDSLNGSVCSHEDLTSSPKIGFIGLGHVGTGIIKKFLNSGCKVMVWNRTASKCSNVTILGATQAESPSELVVSCDIVFCCLSDADASKSLIFGKFGILDGLEMALQLGLLNKGFVEMTSIDPETSQDISEAIERKGGKYLEAPICGTSEDAENGALLIFASGDRGLFMDCKKYFQTISKSIHFVSYEVGNGNKMSLLQSSMSSIVHAALAETLIMAKNMDINTPEFLEVLEKGPLQFQNVIKKGERMVRCDFGTVTPLKHMQKNMDLSLKMGDTLSQPLPVSAAANEVYKRARLLQYSDMDVCSVYQAVRQ